jgi:ABC-type nitrate/sulfonate/bicarbonate transport system substrate-binding protein
MRAFGEFGADYGVFENLSGRELVLFASVWLPERKFLRSAAEVRRMLGALREFCAWSQENHDVALLDAYEKTIPPMERALARLVEAQRWCRSDGGQASTLYEVADLDGPRPTLRDSHGGCFEADLEPRLAAALEVGDRLRARRVEGGRIDVFCCYPQQSATITRG